MKPIAKNFLLMALMVAASGLAVAMRPTQKIAEIGEPVVLETMIPKAFGEWQEQPQNQQMIVDPQQQATIIKLYTQTLSRTYINPEGYRIMLSVAYGVDQRGENEVHKPEVCYPAQGFTVDDIQRGQLDTSAGAIAVTRVRVRLGERREPVTYWTTVGDHVVRTGIDKKLTEARYGLSGRIPDGLLFRVSSIDPESAHAFEKQRLFTDTLLNSLTPEHRQKLIGNPTREPQ